MQEFSENSRIFTTSAEESVDSEVENSGYRIDQRVHATADPRRTGTVRYIGPLEGYLGTWVGVDWDDGEGKSDGTVNEVRYFMAKGEKSGSFARLKILSAGITLLEALHLRYRGDSAQGNEDEMYVLSTRKKRVEIQFLGKDKIQEKLNRFELLVGVSLSYLGVGSTGTPHEISAVVPNLKELDLTGNLLSKWQDIGTICEALPALEVLNLTNNFLERNISQLPLLKTIRILVLNNCGITWKQVEVLKHSLPAVEELHLMANKLKTITPGPSMPMAAYVQGFDSLRVLNLEDNLIDNWGEILKLSLLKSLEQLYLKKNKLKHIFCPLFMDDGELQDKCARPFQNLCCLLLGCNEIADLSSIDSLKNFPSLTDIRLSKNPITDPEKGGLSRFALVARLAKVKILNGSEVTARERKESEIRYVRLVMTKMQSDNLEEIKRLHPRFAELKVLHGIDDEKPLVGAMGPQKMASGLLCINLKCVGASMGDKPSLTKKLPPTTTVGKLKVLCESFFKLKGIKPRLFLEEADSPLPQSLDDEMVTLVDFGIGSGATILVGEEN